MQTHRVVASLSIGFQFVENRFSFTKIEETFQNVSKKLTIEQEYLPSKLHKVS